MSKAEDEMSPDDAKVWAGFETEGIDRILSGEIKPKTLIATYISPIPKRFPERGPLIAKEMLSVFPNSRYMRRGVKSQMHELIALAKKKGCTSLILAQTDHFMGHDTVIIISLLNGAAATFRVLNLTPQEDLPNHAEPTTRRYPRLRMKGFNTPGSVGTARMIQLLFPKAPSSRGRSVAYFEKQNNLIFFRPFRFCSEEAVAGESSSVGTSKQFFGPQFALQLRGVEKVSFDTGKFKLIARWVEPWLQRI